MIDIDSEGDLAFVHRPVDHRDPSVSLPDGAIVETSPIAITLMNAICARLVDAGGALLTIDYGADHPGHGDTLQAVRQHEFIDPLAAPGEVDLTAHVDFPSLAKAAEAAGAGPRSLLTQGDFLNRIGLGARVKTLAEGKDAETREALENAAERLSGRDAMGNLFKVLAVGAPELVLPAFDQDS